MPMTSNSSVFITFFMSCKETRQSKFAIKSHRNASTYCLSHQLATFSGKNCNLTLNSLSYTCINLGSIFLKLIS